MTGASEERLSLHERLRLLPVPLAAALLGVLLISSLPLVLSEVAAVITQRHTASIAAVRERLELTAKLESLLLGAESAQLGYLLTGDRALLQPFDTAVASVDDTTGRLAAVTPEGAGRDLVEDIRRTAIGRLQTAAAVIAQFDAGSRAEAVGAIRAGAGTEQMARLRALIEELEARSQADLAELRLEPGGAVLWTRIAITLCVLLIVGLLVAVTRLLVAAALRQRDEARKKDEEAVRMQRLVDARTAELSELSSYLQSVTERDKAELARNLHDELGGLLTAARMDMAWLHGATRGMNPEIGQKLDQLSHALTEAMDVKRRVVESLRPALLDHFGLPTALQSYFQDTCAKSGLSCETSVDEELRDLSDDVAIALFRVGQEALTNIIRHARARRVDMRLRLAGEDVELVICDDGVGFDPGSRRFLGTHGISGMRHRVQGLGGTFNVARGPGGGTQVSIRVPRVAPPRPVLYADAAP